MTEGAMPLELSYTLSPFRPAGWLRGAHAQTVGGKLLRPALKIPLRRERIETPDGDFLDLDFAPPPPLSRSGGTADLSGFPSDPFDRPADHAVAPVVLVLHGLEGSARRRYMLQVYRELITHGIRAIGLNFRSCSGEPNRTARFYHSGDTEDLRFVLEHLARRFPTAARGVIGFSLGGNVLVKSLGERGDAARAHVDAAAAVSVPYDLAAGAHRLEQGVMGRVYTTYFMRRLHEKMRAKAALLMEHIDVARVLAARTLREFDDAATAPLHGFTDADDYYRRSSCGPLVARIRVPTLLLHAEDDPFLPPAALPRQAAADNRYVTTAFSPYGGHVGFVTGRPWAPRFWAEAEAARFLATQLHPACRPYVGG